MMFMQRQRPLAHAALFIHILKTAFKELSLTERHKIRLFTTYKNMQKHSLCVAIQQKLVRGQQ